VTREALSAFIIMGSDGAKRDLYRLLVTGGILPVGQAAEIAGSFDVHNPRVEQWLKDYSFKFAQKVNQTTADGLRATLTEGLNAGETISELKARVKEVFGSEANNRRAEMIARTESHRAELSGRRELWKEANHDMVLAGEQPIYVGRVWRASPDACDFCLAMDGTQIGLDEVYFQQGSRFEVEDVGGMNLDYEDVEVAGLHPNCRCDDSPVLNPAYLM